MENYLGTDEQLLALAIEAGAVEEGVGHGGAYRQLVLSSCFDPSRPDLHLKNLRRFADLVHENAIKGGVSMSGK